MSKAVSKVWSEKKVIYNIHPEFKRRVKRKEATCCCCSPCQQILETQLKASDYSEIYLYILFAQSCTVRESITIRG